MSTTNDLITRMKDRAESAEAVLRVVMAMLQDETHERDDIQGYLESSMEIINEPVEEGQDDD